MMYLLWMITRMALCHVYINGTKLRVLDLILHTPGGDIAATESLVYYLKVCLVTT